MELVVKCFNELTIEELYEILKLRSDVFVVEQNCVYPDLDDRDQEAIHVFYRDNVGIQAYLRIMDRGVESEHVSIGRVIAVQRRVGLGTQIVEAGIEAAREVFDADIIYLEAQNYVRKLYENLGFQQVSDEFILDGIPHIKMELELE